MAYRLSMEDDPAEGLRRCAAEELAEAIGHLEHGRDDDPVEAIHEARKNLKRTRSLLRLVRADMGQRAYRGRNRSLRDVARGLSGTRDAQVLVQTLQALSERYAGQVPATTFQRLREHLTDEARGADERLSESIDEQIQALREAHHDVAAWPLQSVRWRTFTRGLHRAYAVGRADMRRALRHPSVDAFHEWRKRVKDLDYQQRLLRGVWPTVLSAQAEEAHRLSDLLGDDHDLAVLFSALHDKPGIERGVPADTDPVLALIEHRRRELQGEAKALGLRLYAEPPKRFARRLERIVRAARDEVQAQAHPALVLSPVDGRAQAIYSSRA